MNGEAPVNTRTRELVEVAMSELGYVPSSAARAMRSSRTGLVGLVTGAISGRQAAGGATGLPDLQIVQGIQQILADHGITLLISNTGSRPDRIAKLLRTLREHRVEGIFYVAPHHQRIALPEASHSRLVLVNAFDEAETPCVLPDDIDGQERLTAALITEGYRRALETAGIPYDQALVIEGDHDGQPIERDRVSHAIDLLLALDSPPTVLCCGNDRLAVAVYGILRARGISVPEDVSVAGYDDYQVISETLYPPLTTMELPYSRMGEAAAHLMLSELRGGQPLQQGARVAVKGELRWRASVVPGPSLSIQ
jgi:LacI family transcriptional regulator